MMARDGIEGEMRVGGSYWIRIDYVHMGNVQRINSTTVTLKEVRAPLKTKYFIIYLS